MEMGLVVAIAFGFLCIGCMLGWRAGEHHGLKAATAVFSTQIRQLEGQVNGHAHEAKALKKSAENARNALEKEIETLKTEVETHRREANAARNQIKQERQRYNVLFEPAKLVAQEQSRSAVVKLQAIVGELIEKEEERKNAGKRPRPQTRSAS